MSNPKDWLARDVLIVGELSGAHVIICESAEPLHEIQGEEMAFSVDESLAGENAKLRELLKDMWASMADCHDICATCKHFEDEYESADGSFGHTGECVFLRRMRELGIEVD